MKCLIYILTKGHLLWILGQQLDKALSLTPSTVCLLPYIIHTLHACNLFNNRH